MYWVLRLQWFLLMLQSLLYYYESSQAATPCKPCSMNSTRKLMDPMKKSEYLSTRNLLLRRSVDSCILESFQSTKSMNLVP
ncbi:hypothetical protein F4811DRAFT_522512 [Daldinia bambusicola]|nr:hypothetical protein F4811DRAFT_522512 [Daldinia bambusicola]